MDYSKLSDMQINAAVAICIWDTDMTAKSGEFDPCNNPADAWPIIEDNLIALNPVPLYVGGHRWFASKGDGDFGKKESDGNPLRAAMIVFLMMQESE